MSTLANFTVESIRQWNKAYTDIINPDVDQQNIPVIITQPAYLNPYLNSYKTTPFISLNNNSRLITSGFYKDLNKDKNVQKTFSKYYFYKILEKWIYKELLPLLAFVDLTSGKPQLIKSLADFDIPKLAKNSEEDIQKKINYMENNIITKDMVRHVLKKICLENHINWYDLNKHEKKIKKIFYNYLLNKLTEAISKYSNNNNNDNNN